MSPQHLCAANLSRMTDSSLLFLSIRCYNLGYANTKTRRGDLGPMAKSPMVSCPVCASEVSTHEALIVEPPGR